MSGHAGRLEHVATHQLVVRGTACALDEQGQHHVAAVVVSEALASREDRWVAGKDGEVLLGCGELMDRNGHGVLGDVVKHVLVEVVANAGPVGQQVLHGDVAGDLGQVLVEQRPGRGRQVEPALLHQRHRGQRSEPLRDARGAELGVRSVGDPVRAVGQPERLHDPGNTASVDADHAGEAHRLSCRAEIVLEETHTVNLVAANPPPATHAPPSRSAARL